MFALPVLQTLFLRPKTLLDSGWSSHPDQLLKAQVHEQLSEISALFIANMYWPTISSSNIRISTETIWDRVIWAGFYFEIEESPTFYYNEATAPVKQKMKPRQVNALPVFYRA